jgi:hypothetical protein
MADPLRHRQTKGAATDMVDLTPPRHIPTLPGEAIRGPSRSSTAFDPEPTAQTDPGRAKTAGGEVSSGVDVCGCDCKIRRIPARCGGSTAHCQRGPHSQKPRALRVQRGEQALCLFEIGRVKAFGKPPNRQAREGRGPPRAGPVRARDGQGSRRRAAQSSVNLALPRWRGLSGSSVSVRQSASDLVAEQRIAATAPPLRA